MKTENIIQDKSFRFALDIIKIARALHANHEFVLSRQIMASGTSIGANVEEAIAAQSRSDFRSKMSIASKEARETRYWLRLLKESGLMNWDLSPHLAEIEEIIRILTAIVKSVSEGDNKKH